MHAAPTRSSVSISVARTTPAAAARRIADGIERNEPRILIGGDARLLDLVQRVRPGNYWKVLARLFGGRPTVNKDGS